MRYPMCIEADSTIISSWILRAKRNFRDKNIFKSSLINVCQILGSDPVLDPGTEMKEGSGSQINHSGSTTRVFLSLLSYYSPTIIQLLLFGYVYVRTVCVMCWQLLSNMSTSRNPPTIIIVWLRVRMYSMRYELAVFDKAVTSWMNTLYFSVLPSNVADRY